MLSFSFFLKRCTRRLEIAPPRWGKNDDERNGEEGREKGEGHTAALTAMPRGMKKPAPWDDGTWNAA